MPTRDTERLDAEAETARDLTHTILRFYGYTDADIAEAERIHPGRVCSEDECWDEDGKTIHPPAYDELGGTASTVVEIVLPWLAARDAVVAAQAKAEALAPVLALADQWEQDGGAEPFAWEALRAVSSVPQATEES